MNLSQTRRNKSKWCTIAVTVNGCQYLSLKYQYPCLKYKYKHQYQYKYLKMVLKYRSSTSTSTQYYNPGTQQTWLLTTTTSFFDNAIDLPWLNFSKSRVWDSSRGKYMYPNFWRYTNFLNTLRDRWKEAYVRETSSICTVVSKHDSLTQCSLMSL